MRASIVADAVVGEPEAAVAVHHEVVRAAQRTTVALGVEIGDRAVVEVDPLDPPTDVRGRVEAAGGSIMPAEVERRERSTVVAQVDRAVRPDGGAVRATGGSRRSSRCVPSGCTLVSRGPNISTSTTDPSGIAIGPSGKRSPLATSVSSGVSSVSVGWSMTTCCQARDPASSRPTS